MKKEIKVLFVCKKRQDSYGISYGLINSCKFLCNILTSLGVKAKVVSVVDNNAIDNEVYKYKPTHVFIEALWVVPSKFEVLLPRYPNVQWYVRLHSNTSFLANEGIAIEWLNGYEKVAATYGNLNIAPNSEKLVTDLFLSLRMVTQYAPNVYMPPEYDAEKLKIDPPEVDRSEHVINIGCFGAVRPMKNHLLQAMAAMAFANKHNKELHFHINATRVEQQGQPVLKNLRNLFKGQFHELIEHPWMDHHQFWKLVRKMDLGMQVSLTETFNIVAADLAYNHIPVIGSKEIPWLSMFYKANPTNIKSIIRTLDFAYWGQKYGLQHMNYWGIQKYNYDSIKAWKKLLDI